MRMTEPGAWSGIQALIGEDLATQLSANLGGARLYIPRFAGPQHPLTQAVGDRAAAMIVAAMAGDELDVPIGLGRDARIAQLREAGQTVNQIAVAVNCSRRTVQAVLARKRGDEQLDLFA